MFFIEAPRDPSIGRAIGYAIATANARSTPPRDDGRDAASQEGLLAVTEVDLPYAVPPRRSVQITDAPVEYPLAQAARLASLFDVPTPLETYDFPEKGNINQHTFVVVSGRRDTDRVYLLQKINQQVFVKPRSVMAAMMACIDAQNRALARGMLGPDEEWEAITLLPTRSTGSYLDLQDRRGESVWRLMVKIPESKTFKSLSEIADPAERLSVASEAGRGLALFGDMTADMDVSGLANPLPGYRNTRVYFDQLHSVLRGNRTLEEVGDALPADPEVRASTERHFLLHIPDAEYRKRTQDPVIRPFIDLALAQETLGLTLSTAMASGRIRTVAIHGDTKLDNFLFSSRTGKVKALIDLDTIMPHTWLSDWGDMVRSLSNVAGEKETNLDRVQVDVDIFRAVAEGFLGAAGAVTEEEVGLMVDAVRILALELGVRFLSDYLRGDSYFRLGPADPPDLNKTRAMAQLTLFQRITDRAGELQGIIDELRTRGHA